jgi:hypothetical protein
LRKHKGGYSCSGGGWKGKQTKQASKHTLTLTAALTTRIMNMATRRSSARLNGWRLVQLLVVLRVVPSVLADSQDNNYNNNNNNNRDGSQDEGYYNNDYGSDDDGNFITRLANRVGADMAEMWQSAPSDWGAEYWEVFASLGLLAFFLLALHCCMAYDMCCSTEYANARAGGREQMTQEQLQQRQQEQEKEQHLLSEEPHQQQEQQLLDEEQRALDEGKTPRSRGAEGPFQQPTTFQGIADTTTADAITTAKELEGQSAGHSKPPFWHGWKRGTRTMYHTGKEVASVWGEFLGELMPPSSREADKHFKYHQHSTDVEAQGSSRRLKKTRRRRSGPRSDGSLTSMPSSTGPSTSLLQVSSNPVTKEPDKRERSQESSTGNQQAKILPDIA